MGSVLVVTLTWGHPGIELVGARDAKCPEMYKIVPENKELSDPKCQLLLRNVD